MKHHYRMRFHFNNGFAPSTVPLIAASTWDEAKAQFERTEARIDANPKYFTHIKSVALYAGHKRIEFRTYVDGVVQ